MADPIPYGTIIMAIIAVFVLLALVWLKTLKIVKPNEIHVVTTGNKCMVKETGRYHILPIINKVQVIHKDVMEIESPNIKAHDMELLPFEVVIACKVRIVDGLVAAQNFGDIRKENLKTFIEDTIFSAMRSTAMTKKLLDVMRKRDEIEGIIFSTTQSALAKIGIEVVLFDIKDIIDSQGSTVIKDMERLKSAELQRMAREAEAIQGNQAKIIEAEKNAESEVARQKATQAKEIARIEQEKAVAESQMELSTRRYEVFNLETKRQAEIERDKIMIAAQAEADKAKLVATGNSEAMRIRAQAEADGIKMRMLAEAEGTKKIAEALQSLTQTGIAVKIAEIHKEATIESARAIASALKDNTKVFLPIGGQGTNILESLIPGIVAMRETGYDLASITTASPSKKKEKEEK